MREWKFQPSGVNLRPDPARNERRVEIRGQAIPNATEICYPGTTLRLVYRRIRSSVLKSAKIARYSEE